MLLGIFFDFFDGLAARLLNAKSELGLQLDSLADMVTSGVAAGIIMFQLISRSLADWSSITVLGNSIVSKSDTMLWGGAKFSPVDLLPYVGLVLTLAAAYRLAKFNIDTRQTNSFIGLPTPAMALYVVSLPLIIAYAGQESAVAMVNNPIFLIISTLALSVLMNIELQLFALKFKELSFNKNLVPILFLIVAVLLLILIKFVAIPVIIVLYLLFSLFYQKS